MRAIAFCPGHITGFFQICEHEEPLRSGSRGAGICINLGATSTVVSNKGGTGDIEVYINGEKNDAPVTKQALAQMTFGRDIDLSVETVLDLPMGQGFGMSAAGALSAALATTEILEEPFQTALEAAHEAEVLHRTGLGDVAALSKGGITFRRIEGVPPYGRVERMKGDIELVLATVGPPISTPTILLNPDLRERINLIGKECIAGLGMSPTLASFFRLSKEFAMRTGLATRRVEEVLTEIEYLGPSSMVMLGNSVFASGDTDELERVLVRYGSTYRVRVDGKGPRVVETRS